MKRGIINAFCYHYKSTVPQFLSQPGRGFPLNKLFDDYASFLAVLLLVITSLIFSIHLDVLSNQSRLQVMFQSRQADHRQHPIFSLPYLVIRRSKHFLLGTRRLLLHQGCRRCLKLDSMLKLSNNGSVYSL